MSVVRLIVATRSSGPPASGKIIKEMPGSVASGTPYINYALEIGRSELPSISIFLNKSRPSVFILIRVVISFWGNWWCSWLRHSTISRKVAGSILNDVIGIFH